MGKRRANLGAAAGGQQLVIEALRANVDALEQQAAYWRERFEASRPEVGRIDRLTRLLERWLTGGSERLAAETRLELYGDEDDDLVDLGTEQRTHTCGGLAFDWNCKACAAS